MGWEKLAIFDGNRRLSLNRCELGRWLLWNINRKSWVRGAGSNGIIFENLSDLRPRFQGHDIF